MEHADAVRASSLSNLIARSNEQGVPLIIDVNCFELGRDNLIFNPHLSPLDRAEAALKFKAWGESFGDIDALKGTSYFPTGTYDSIYQSTKAIRDLSKRCAHHARTKKYSDGNERRTADNVTDKAFDTLEHDAWLAYRVWRRIRCVTRNRQLPHELGTHLQERYDENKSLIAPALYQAFSRLSSAEPQPHVRERVESMVVGAMTLAQQNKACQAYVATRDPFMLSVFAKTYAESRGAFDPSRSPRVHTFLFNGEERPTHNYFSYKKDAPVLNGAGVLSLS